MHEALTNENLNLQQFEFDSLFLAFIYISIT